MYSLYYVPVRMLYTEYYCCNVSELYILYFHYDTAWYHTAEAPPVQQWLDHSTTIRDANNSSLRGARFDQAARTIFASAALHAHQVVPLRSWWNGFLSTKYNESGVQSTAQKSYLIINCCAVE